MPGAWFQMGFDLTGQGPTMEEVNWESLPKQYTQFVPYFNKYGTIHFQNKVDYTLKSMTDIELHELRLAYRLLEPIFEQLIEWIGHTELTRSRAAARVYFAILFLEIANDRKLI
ncbi:MAG: hypothetical protein ACRC8S_09915 [Fimbriiglobus sp.]